MAQGRFPGQERFAGVGLGLRRPHLEAVAARPEHGVPFWETCPENVIGDGGRPHRDACAILDRDPVLTHGLAISVGGFDPWDGDYLRELGRFLIRTETPWHSEHLCFTSVDGSCLHELLPIPFTREAVRHTVARARDLQARLPVPLLLENITYYAELGRAEMDEATFITEVLEGAEVGWLLDVNNVYVNALNFGFDPKAWLARMPLDRVAQLHIAGHKRFGALTVDTHGTAVIDPVIELMQWVLARLGRPVPVLLERDNHIPDLEELLSERARIQAAYDQVLAVPVREAEHA
ncbi:UPF0276 protein [Geothrix oryzae]|uniref:UPF0276 protein n=1 Tax=Geothrix oryzae TaxID=2927975 RepID=A0ABN6UU57_9BACT|nr:DUF692 domain-containing protein [Geothrix oryzae]BDU68267.1 UPF0276 protein [Geothrix oryzae]